MTIEFYNEETHGFAPEKRPMDIYTACSIVEGFDGEEHTAEEQHEAWQHLIDTGACWFLQGWYGRCAMDLIRNGTCRPASGVGR
jgi:hypothetical protein